MENQLPQSNMPTIWETNPKLKTLLLVLIFVFLLSGIGLTAFSVLSNNYRQKVYEETKAGLPKHEVKQATTMPELQATQIKAYTISDSSLEGWKIFNGHTVYGEQFKFSAEFPTTWNFIESQGQPTLVKGECQIVLGAGGHGLEGYELKNKEPVTVSGIQTTINIWGERVSSSEGAVMRYYNTQVLEGNDDYIFNLIAPLGYKNCDEDYKNILKTVKIGQNTDTSIWKTYRNDEYGFEFSYPSYWSLSALNSGGGYDSTKPYLLVWSGVVSDAPCQDLGCPPKSGDRIELIKSNTSQNEYYPFYKIIKVEGKKWLSVQLTDVNTNCNSDTQCQLYLKSVPLEKQIKLDDSKYTEYNNFLKLIESLKLQK